MTDDELVRLVRAAIPPTTTADEPSTDLWPLLVGRIEQHPMWLGIDLSLAVAIAAASLIIPEWFSRLVYYL